MSDISVIGPRLMGAALAAAINRAGHDLTAWNRSLHKMQPLLAAGKRSAGYDEQHGMALHEIMRESRG